MIRRVNLMTLISHRCNLAHRPTIINPITPGRSPFLLTRIVLVSTHIILVRRSKRDRCLTERSKSEPRVLPTLDQELVVFKEFVEVVATDGGEDGFAGEVDAVV